MKINVAAVLVASAAVAGQGANAKLFGKEPVASDPSTWSIEQAKTWLETHKIHVPTTTDDILAAVQANFDLVARKGAQAVGAGQAYYEVYSDKAVDSWSESQLREFLLEQGVVSPKGTVEELRIAAKQRASAVSTAMYGHPTDQATKSIASAYGDVQASATSLYNQAVASGHSASASVSSLGSYASAKAQQTLDVSKDYVWSTWDDNKLRNYLEEKNVIEAKSTHPRNFLLQKMSTVYHKYLNDPVYHTWSDNYLKGWMVAHGILQPPTDRESMLMMMKNNYWEAKDKVWSSWSDIQMRDWLVSEGILSNSASDLKREKYEQLLTDNYHKAKSTVFSGWHDSELRDYLVQHGLVKSDYEAKRDDMIKMVGDKYQATSSPYLAWPDARLRAYLRDHGVDDTKYASRPSLVHEVRIRYVQAGSRVEGILAKIREAIGGGVDYAEEKLSSVLEILTGSKLSLEQQLEKNYASASASASSLVSAASASAVSLGSNAIAQASSASHSAINSASSVSASAASAADSASASLSSAASKASVVASKSGSPSASSAASVASKSASSAGAYMSSSAASVASEASKSASSFAASASKSASSASSSLSVSAVSASKEASKTASIVSASLSSAYHRASLSAASVSSVASASASSASKSASSYSASLAKESARASQSVKAEL